MSSNANPDIVYLTLDTEILRRLNENNQSIELLLERAKVSGLTKVGDPASREGARDAGVILMASAVVIAAATPLIRDALSKVINRPILTEEQILEPALDGSGMPIYDNRGRPVMKWTKKSSVDRPLPMRDDDQPVSAQGFGIKLSIGK